MIGLQVGLKHLFQASVTISQCQRLQQLFVGNICSERFQHSQSLMVKALVESGKGPVSGGLAGLLLIDLRVQKEGSLFKIKKTSPKTPTAYQERSLKRR